MRRNKIQTVVLAIQLLLAIDTVTRSVRNLRGRA
jgi:hypothetical protein